MKKILLRLGLAIVVLLVIAVVVAMLSLNGLIKRGVETYGPKLTGVDVKLESVNVSLWSGSGTLKGFTVGNPQGFKAQLSMSVGSATIALKPSSLIGNKIVINKVEMVAPEITLELSLNGNNLGKILANVNAATGSSDTNVAARPKEAAATGGTKLQVDDFLITGAKVHAAVTELGQPPKTVTISDIHLTNLGAGPEGITTGELLKVILPVIEREAIKAATTTYPELSKYTTQLNQIIEKNTGTTLTNLTHSLDKATSGSLTNVTKGLNDLLKKK